MVEKHTLGFEVLTDPDNALAREFGIVYEVTGELAGLYEKFGLDLAKLHGVDRSELPLAASYVIDTNGVIKYAYLHADYSYRAEPDDMIAVLKSL